MSEQKKHRLAWRREKVWTGLMSMVQGERGYELFCDGERIGSASPKYEGWGRVKNGYYWFVAKIPALGVEWRNTSNSPVSTIEEAKDQCMSYVKECLAKAGEHL